MAGALALFVLAIAGQACALLLIDVRPYAHFQHYQPWSWLLDGVRPAVAGVLVQTVVVTALAWRFRRDLLARFGRAVPFRAWLLLVILGGASLIVPSVSVAFSAGELVLAAALALVALLNLLLVVLMLPAAVLDRGARAFERWDRRIPWMVALFVTLMSAFMSAVVLERLPHIDDGVSNLFQAKYFAFGNLYLPAPPDAEAFRMDLTVIQDGKWFGYAFPGWPAVLAIGVLAGVPWLVNPILGGVLILLAHAWVRNRWGRATANATVLLLGTSSWLIFMQAEMMGHSLTAVLAMLALVAWDKAIADTRDRFRFAVITGCALGALFLTRSFDALLVTAAVGAIALADGFRRALPALAAAGLAAAIIGALIFPYNAAVTGRATYPAHEAWADWRYGPGIDVVGFGPNVGIDRWPNLDPLPGHGPADVVLNLNKNLFMTNFELFGWATGSLLFVWIAFGVGGWRRQDVPLLALPAIFVAGYSFFWFSGGPDLGARYWYPLIVPLAVLTVRGAQMLAARFPDWTAAPRAATASVAALLVVASVSAAVTVLPWRAATKHYRYRGISGEVRALAATSGFEHGLVFVRSDERSDFQSGYVLNPPTQDDPGTIYASDEGPTHNAAVVASFNDRAVWVIGRRQDASGERPFVVLEGPLAPGTVPR